MMIDTASSVSDQAKADELEGPEPAAPRAAEEGEAAPAQRGQLLTPELLQRLRWALPAAWFLGVLVAGYVSGIQFAFLVAAAGVLVLVITLMWSSVQSLTGGASLGFEEALGMGAPSRAEEEKRAVLRALKDLEYERSVGKISPEDYAELSAKYRAEAKRLIQNVDSTLAPAREQVERALQQRLAREGLADPPPEPKSEPLPGPESKPQLEAEPESEAEPEPQPKPEPEPEAKS